MKSTLLQFNWKYSFAILLVYKWKLIIFSETESQKWHDSFDIDKFKWQVRYRLLRIWKSEVTKKSGEMRSSAVSRKDRKIAKKCSDLSTMIFFRVFNFPKLLAIFIKSFYKIYITLYIGYQSSTIIGKKKQQLIEI